MKRTLWIIVTMAMAAGILCGLAGCSGSDSSAPSPARGTSRMAPVQMN